MKPMETLLNVIARKKPRQVFTAHVGNKKIRGIEQEFILAPSDSRSREKVQVQYVGGSPRLLGGRFHFISVKNASERYRIPIRTIQQLCHDGKLVCQRQGGNENSPWLVAEESMQAYCNAQRA